jgi:hypothetical protein
MSTVQYLIVCECLGLGEPIQLLMPDLFALPRLASTHITCVPNRYDITSCLHMMIDLRQPVGTAHTNGEWWTHQTHRTAKTCMSHQTLQLHVTVL